MYMYICISCPKDVRLNVFSKLKSIILDLGSSLATRLSLIDIVKIYLNYTQGTNCV